MNVVLDITYGRVELVTANGTVLTDLDPSETVDLADELITAVTALGVLAGRRKRRFTRLARMLRRIG